MTAVAPPPNFQTTSRWSSANGPLNSVSAEDVSRMFMPRKSAQRSNSSTSLSSNASSTSTVSASSGTVNGAPPAGTADGQIWGARRKPTGNRWPPSKAEPMASLSNARPQPVSSTSGPSAVSAIAALHSPSAMLPSQQHNGQVTTQPNSVSRVAGQGDNLAVLHLLPMNGTFERKTITVPFFPEVLKIGRQTNAKTMPTPLNGYFDSKVLSRQHAEVWSDRNGKIWIRDVKSSNGTFVNGQRLSQENRDSDPHELHEQDMLELGIDIVSEDQKTIVHHKVAARVEYAGMFPSGPNNTLELNFGELDPQVNGNVMNSMLGQSMGQLRRTGSQGSMASNGRMSGPASVAGSNASGFNQQRHVNFWLQPVTMEQVVKKLNTELKMAKKQSHDLQRTNHFLDSLLANEPKKEPQRASPPHVKTNPIKATTDIKTRFSDPPAPPPQQPLPEKPDAVRSLQDASHQPQLKRTDTERPKLNASPIRTEPPHQLNPLAEALTTARKEIESQNLRLKDLESLLAAERQARETAEERALRLELESQARQNAAKELSTESEGTESDLSDMEATIVEAQETESTNDDEIAKVDATSSSIQLQLERMVEEMGKMKQQLEEYRQRAEKAEMERDEERASLASLVEKIRKEEAERAAKKQRSKSPATESNGKPRHSTKENGDAYQNGHTITPENAMALLRQAGVEHNRPMTPEQASKLEKAFSQVLAQPSRRNEALAVHGGPVASMVTVVLLGVGLMAWLNSWPKVER